MVTVLAAEIFQRLAGQQSIGLVAIVALERPLTCVTYPAADPASLFAKGLLDPTAWMGANSSKTIELEY